MNALFAETLKKLRTERGLSQNQLGKQLFVNHSTIARWENGSRLPDATMIPRLANCLGVDSNTLFQLSDQSEESPNVIMVDDSKVILSEKRRKQLSRKAWLSFLIALLPMTVAVIVHTFIDIYPLIDISTVLATLSMYSLILSDQIGQDLHRQREIARQQQEIANQRANIMVLQMRPHFIYNTMTSIYCLCNQDPQLARQVVLDFTTYLRKNFTAIASAAPIPFSSELEHTRAYLAVEQAQYEDSLFVEYDTPHTWFRVPPLTLQPIVENAVKHGRDPYAGAFHISIRTRKTDFGSEIVIADNGRGFQPADDSETHLALKNIQQRLESMCGGSLIITPKDGGGTVVTVTIPDRAAE